MADSHSCSMRNGEPVETGLADLEKEDVCYLNRNRCPGKERIRMFYPEPTKADTLILR